ncbi:MAG TPA: Gfo/Idh/MocA family oxidoreductase [Solirubrobacterales bacterium]|nr:Gfo/Idh/MocA family oxidoreductase [Solirubrobacterales bacterium]
MHSGRKNAIGLGVIGLGYWGPNHIRVVQESERTNLNWICDSNQTRLTQMSSKTRAATTTQVEKVFNDPATDAVIISTPISTHYELGMSALEAGKHVLIEKPIAGSQAEADDLINAAEQNGLVIMCGHTFLFSPPVVAIKEIIRRGELGDIYFISSSRVNLGLHQSDASVLWDLAPHDFSIILNWIDEVPVSVSSVGRDSIGSGVFDVAFTNLVYESGLIANVELSWLAPSKLRRTTVVGSKKMIVYDDTAPEQVRVFDRGVNLDNPETFGAHQLTYRAGDIVSPHLASSEPMSVQLNSFVDAVVSGNYPAEYIRIARDVVGLIEAAERSLTNLGVRTEYRAMQTAQAS